MRPVVARLRELTVKFSEMVARVEAGDKECVGFKDFHARRLVETAGHIIISYLLARQAGESEEYAPSARIFSKLAEGKIAEAYTYVMNSPTEDVGLFRDVERQGVARCARVPHRKGASGGCFPDAPFSRGGARPERRI